MGTMTTALRRMTGELIQVTQWGRLNKKHYPCAIYGPSNVVRCYTPPDRLGFESDHESGRLEIAR